MPQETKSLKGLTFCISGTLSEKRKEIQALIKKNGGKAENSVTKEVRIILGFSFIIGNASYCIRRSF